VEKETFDVRLIGADTPETVGKPGENQYEHGKAAADSIKSELTAATQFEVEPTAALLMIACWDGFI
jgi:endonuclease YncB( thermonuclease family)